MSGSPRPGCRGITLVEALVVVALIVTLLALLLPSMNSAKYSARLATCSGNGRQIGAAHLTYSFDFMGWLPYGATEMRVIDGEERWMLPTGTSPDSTPGLAPYLHDSGSIKAQDNPVLQCAQNIVNYDRNDQQSYAFYANRINAQGNNQKPYYDRSSEGTWQRTWQYAVKESMLLRRANDDMDYDGFSNAWHWDDNDGKYTIMFSDVAERGGSGLQVLTNHVRGDDNPLVSYWKGKVSKVVFQSGVATVNYGMTDGSIVPYTFPVFPFRDLMQIGNKTEGGAKTIMFPKEWAK